MQLVICKKEREYCKLDLPLELACGITMHTSVLDDNELEHPEMGDFLSSIQKAFPSKVREQAHVPYLFATMPPTSQSGACASKQRMRFHRPG
ncbi:MAG: hypothetical protein SGPRY_002556 [Prymnesium sp.]